MEFAVFQFDIIAKDELRLPLYKGSAFRGLFGHALKKTSCVTNKLDCNDCMLRAHCAYAYIFETQNQRKEQVVRPFIIEPPMVERHLFPPGDVLKMRVILFGKAIEFLPYVVYAFKEMGKRGIGSSRGKFWLQLVRCGQHIVYDFRNQQLDMSFERIDLFELGNEETVPEKVHLSFVTPTVLKINGRKSETFGFPHLVRAITRRIKAISVYHTEEPSALPRYSKQALEEVQEETSAMRPFYWKRYSGRQKTTIDLSGVVGQKVFSGNIQPFWKLLRIGELLHVGKGTVYGMGKYLVEDI